jgi:hypothetical protein
VASDGGAAQAMKTGQQACADPCSWQLRLWRLATTAASPSGRARGCACGDSQVSVGPAGVTKARMAASPTTMEPTKPLKATVFRRHARRLQRRENFMAGVEYILTVGGRQPRRASS